MSVDELGYYINSLFRSSEFNLNASRLEVRISNESQDLYVEFVYCGCNIFGYYKLSDMDFEDLSYELNKFLKDDQNYKKWLAIEKIDNRIEKILR